MADDRLAKFRDFPIRMYVDAILERDPGKSLLYESVCDYNDSENQANQRSVSNHIVPVETNAPDQYSDDCETSSRNDSDSDFEISEDSDNELQDDAAVFERETVKEHVTPFKRTSVQPAKAKITSNGSDYDKSRTISDIPTRLGNVSRCPNDKSVDGGVNNNENNIPVDDANSGKKVNKIKEKKPILLTRIKKYLEGSKKKSDKFSVLKVNSGKRGGSKARRTIDVEDDDDDITLFSSRKQKANKFDLNKKQKEVNVKKPRLDEAETSKCGAARRRPVVVLALEANKQKAVPADKPRPVVAKPLIRGPKDRVDEIDGLFAGRKVPKGLRSRSVFGRIGEMEKDKAVQVKDQQLDAARPLNGAPKELKFQAEKNGSFRKVEKAVCLGDGEMAARPSSYGFGGLLRFEPSGSLAMVRAGQSNKQKAVQAKDIGGDKHKASSSRSGLGQFDEVKEQKAAAKAIEPWFNVVKETNNGPKWHAKCKESGVCSELDKGGPSASVPLWGRANSRQVDREVMVCQVNRNPVNFETAIRFMRKDLTRINL